MKEDHNEGERGKKKKKQKQNFMSWKEIMQCRKTGNWETDIK